MNLEPPVQYYATTLRDRYQSDQTLSFFFIPARSLKDGKVPATLNGVSQALGSPTTPKDLSPFQVPLALASLLQTAGPDPFSWIALESGASISIDPRALGFAEFVAFSEVVPFERSPLEGKSPLAIAAAAGAKIGFLAAGGLVPAMVLITVPAGILLCTAAVILGPHVGNWIGRLLG
jgi:hypothetical protein